MTVAIKWAGSPRSYTAGRPRPIQFVVLHYTAGAEGDQAAENGAAYDKRRTDGVSTHYFTDSAGSAIQEVHDVDQAHAALYHGNAIGVQIEICGTAQTRAQWLDAVSRRTLETTAALVAHLCKAHDLPAVRLTVAQCRAAWYAAAGKRPRGIVDHGTVTRAFPEDGGTHTDLGPGFPWDVFMDLVEQEMNVALTDDDARKVSRTDGAVDNNMAWRSDSPLHEPKPAKPNLTVQLQTAVLEGANEANRAADAAEQVLDLLESGTPVTLNDAQMAELRAGIAADVVAELRALQWVATSLQP
jgi:N-acetyl-anhydromuramyl-L-alanine amidase AmpD